ncbi:50S ribosomal protein L9 [Candidatus Walczuchella endosymbiont of Icerya purchasi]|uniref:50S ribosomal protein L9 n=1 Tax=Candidatus Walczuchella endosymbiont of Icerya purchasi TaxID=3066219 RepID=UPI00313ED594
MRIILKKDIDNLGLKYEEIVVKPGFARNYLIPNGYAELSTKSNKKKIQEILKQRSKKEENLIKKAKEIAEKLRKIHLKIKVRTGSDGKLFGSINNNTIEESLRKYDIKVDKNLIILNKVKILGKHRAEIRLHRKIKVSLPFELISTKVDHKKK